MRWPNDVVVAGRKLAGVLAELREGKLVIGVGVNANLTAADLPADARVSATSLRILRGEPVDRARLLADLVAAIEARYDRFERDGFTGLERDELRGRHVELAGGASGVSARSRRERPAGRRRARAHLGRGNRRPRGRTNARVTLRLT